MTQSGRVSSFVVADSLVLPCLLEAVRQENRQLLVAANRVCLESMSSTGDSMVVDHFISFINNHYFSRCQTIHSTQI